MGLVIDVDAHFEPGKEWLEDFPDLAKRLPKLDTGALAVKSAFGDLVDSIPEYRRPPINELLPPGLLQLFAQEKADEKGRKLEFEAQSMMGKADAPARLKWMDAQGIDVQNVICLSGMSYLHSIEDCGLRQEVVRAVNNWLYDTCARGGRGRLLPVTNLDCSDLDWAIGEMGRMRKLGSRLVLVPGAPVNGMSPAHPEWDKFWSAVTDNGMIALFHVGFGRIQFEAGWSNTDGDATLLRQFGCNFHHFEPQLFLSALTLGGVFERHPTLTVLTAEVGTGWLPSLLHQIDDRASDRAQLWLGKWKYPMKPSEYIKRNVRGTPLAWGMDQPLEVIMQQLPDDMIVFSSDFPHFEGYQDPMGYYALMLERMDQRKRDLFLGDSIRSAFARMGDPFVFAPEEAVVG